MVSFKHIAFNVKRQYPFAPASTISLVAAGTGIAPVYQVALPLAVRVGVGARASRPSTRWP